MRISPAVRLEGDLRPPSDKSLTHRAFLLAGVAMTPSEIAMPLLGEDCQATLACLAQMTVRAERIDAEHLRVLPPTEWRQPVEPLDCGNSGTTMRLLAGLIASRPIDATLIGDASLSRRPMRRIADPLRLMGARFEGETPPLRVGGGQLRGIDYASPVASAQVKSCLLLAGLRAEGTTRVSEPSLSRDHTERMLRALGVEVGTGRVDGLPFAEVSGDATFQGFNLRVPADISSAAFWAVGAAMLPGSRVALRDVGVNPTRTGLMDVLGQCGVRHDVSPTGEELGEPVADLSVWGDDGPYRPFEIGGDLVPRLIDEIPVLAVLATRCAGVSRIRGAGELRVKESDRIEAVAGALRAMGADVETSPDGLDVSGPCHLSAATIHAAGDHRMAMAFAIAGLLARGETVIEGAEVVATSYPGFAQDLASLAVY